jgi:hypothetical protein
MGMPSETDLWASELRIDDPRENPWQELRKHLQRVVPVGTVAKPNVLAVTFIQRERSRAFADLDRLVVFVRERFDANVESELMEKLDLAAAWGRMASSQIVVAVMGAGLLHAIFMPAGSVVVTFVATGSVSFKVAAAPVLRALALCSIQAMAVMRWDGRGIFDATSGIQNVSTVSIPLSALDSLLQAAVRWLGRPLPAIPDRIVWYT